MDKIAVEIGQEFFGGKHFLRDAEGVGSLVSILVSNALILAGIIFLFILVGGGIAMIAGAGRNDPEQAAKGKQAATAAVIGFIIIFAAFWIIQIIELVTGIDILK
ncbi:hypothetical protein IID21_03470 [Patescibacteria group bacterium]|nr:hypothetical protein [Patescibacteria group bacterium]